MYTFVRVTSYSIFEKSNSLPLENCQATPEKSNELQVGNFWST